MSYATLKVDTRDGVEILSLNRPQALNALSPEMARELTDYFTGLTSRLDVRVVILRGEGRLFCAGADLGTDAFAESGAGRARRQMAMQKLYSGVVRAMRCCPQPIVALIHGAACGGGLSLALAADVRYAAPNARMNAAYIKVGLGGCDMGAGYLLPRLVGLSKLAADMLKTAPMGLRLTKETLNAEIDAPGLDAALTLEDRQQVLLLETADHREAVKAFLEKRTPVYRDA